MTPAGLSIELGDSAYAPFSQQEGLGRAAQLFGVRLNSLLEELNGVLVGMSFFKRLLWGGSAASLAAATTITAQGAPPSDPAKDPNMIQVYDAYGPRDVHS